MTEGYNLIVNMENIITKQMYTVVNACLKNRIFSLAIISSVKQKRRGF
jgi:hypothetical protein